MSHERTLTHRRNAINALLQLMSGVCPRIECVSVVRPRLTSLAPITLLRLRKTEELKIPQRMFVSVELEPRPFQQGRRPHMACKGSPSRRLGEARVSDLAADNRS